MNLSILVFLRLELPRVTGSRDGDCVRFSIRCDRLLYVVRITDFFEIRDVFGGVLF